MEQDCVFCAGAFDHTIVAEHTHWTTQLYTNQYYPGRCLIILDRHIRDLLEMNDEEREELFRDVLPLVTGAIDTLFDPDMYNYASLGNDARHLHIHVIPRYADERQFQGTVFHDENWNSHYKPYPKDFTIPDTTHEQLRTELTRLMR